MWDIRQTCYFDIFPQFQVYILLQRSPNAFRTLVHNLLFDVRHSWYSVKKPTNFLLISRRIHTQQPWQKTSTIHFATTQDENSNSAMKPVGPGILYQSVFFIRKLIHSPENQMKSLRKPARAIGWLCQWGGRKWRRNWKMVISEWKIRIGSVDIGYSRNHERFYRAGNLESGGSEKPTGYHAVDHVGSEIFEWF